MKSLYTLTIVLLMAQYVLSNDDIVLGLTFTVSEKKASEYAKVIKDNVHARAAAKGNQQRRQGDGGPPTKIMQDTRRPTTHPGHYLILEASAYSSSNECIIKKYQEYRKDNGIKKGIFKKKIEFLEEYLHPVKFLFFLNVNSEGSSDSFPVDPENIDSINKESIRHPYFESKLFSLANHAKKNNRNPLNMETKENQVFRFFPYDKYLDKETDENTILFTTPESLRNSKHLTE